MKKRLFAGFAALCMAASLASAAFAETATPETARAEPPQAVQYDASEDAAGFAVSAAAEPGVLPDGAQLAVSLLDDSAEDTPEPIPEYGERAAALDLTFYKEDAAVEPNGTVKVSIQLPEALAADLQAVESPTVVHRVQQDDGTTTPEVVAEADAFSADRTQVSFETDSFSVYEIYGVVTQGEQQEDAAKDEQADTYAWDDYKRYQGVAAIYYLATPDGVPGSNDTKYWAPTSDKSTLLGKINTTGATWQQVGGYDKNIVNNVSKYIVSWPDGSTGSTWTVKRGDAKTGASFTYILDSIWNAYAAQIRKDTGVTNLAKVDVTEITLTPFKISRDNSQTENQEYHIDCTISVKCSKVFTAKFWVKEPGAADYTLVDAKNYKADSKVTKTTKETIGSTKVVNGVTYVLTGWYAENDDGGAKGGLIPDSNWPYTPSTKELADGTVNFYAEYVPMYSQVTVSKNVTGALGDKAKDFNFTLTVTDSTGKAITAGIKAKKNSNEEIANIGSGYQFTLKNGESIVFTNVPTGATVKVTETDYTGTNGGYSTSYVADGGQSTQGREAVLTNINADNHTIAFTNNKDIDPDTGITLHSMPYLLVLAGVLVGGTAWMRRRKRS